MPSLGSGRLQRNPLKCPFLTNSLAGRTWVVVACPRDILSTKAAWFVEVHYNKIVLHVVDDFVETTHELFVGATCSVSFALAGFTTGFTQATAPATATIISQLGEEVLCFTWPIVTWCGVGVGDGRKGWVVSKIKRMCVHGGMYVYDSSTYTTHSTPTHVAHAPSKYGRCVALGRSNRCSFPPSKNASHILDTHATIPSSLALRRSCRYHSRSLSERGVFCLEG